MASNEPDTIVLGAGVVGLATALYLQRAGTRTVVIDPLPPAGGTSFGNAGMISADTSAPVAMPGMLRKVPGWLADPLGPLAVRPSYLPTALPWLLRWIEAGRLSRVLPISDAMRALNRTSFDHWRELIGPEHFRDLIKPAGQVHIWEGEQETASAAIERRLRERQDIKAEMLTAGDLRQMFPGIARDARRGVFVPGNGYTVSPARLVRTLADLFRAEGGEIIAERALKILPREGGPGYWVLTNIDNRAARNLVVATGAWSRELLDPLRIKVPLESERGYHVMLASPGLELRCPILFKSRGFGLTSMEDGLRVAGTVEIAGLKHPPNERRAHVLVEHARRLFPDLKTEDAKIWMGHRPSTPDSLPILGGVPNRPNLFLAFGHGHFGMTGGPPSARIVADMVLGKTPAIDPTAYGIGRFG